MEAPSPDWCELPADILYGVLTLLECPDLLRSAAVCAAWHTAYSTLRRAGICPVRQTPCLLYCTEAAGGLEALGMYSLSEQRSYTMPPLPQQPPVMNWIGSSHGWLVTMDDKVQDRIRGAFLGFGCRKVEAWREDHAGVPTAKSSGGGRDSGGLLRLVREEELAHWLNAPMMREFCISELVLHMESVDGLG